MVIVYLLRAVLADLHEEGVELGDDEGDPDSEACVRHYRAGVASMASIGPGLSAVLLLAVT